MYNYEGFVLPSKQQDAQGTGIPNILEILSYLNLIVQRSNKLEGD